MSQSVKHTKARLIPLLKGIATHVPGANTLFSRTGSSDNARYCYSVWLRHLVLTAPHRKAFPRTVAELGPGDSLGTAIAALLSGVEKVYAFDTIRYAPKNTNQHMIEEILALFKRREPIPDENEFPELKPKLDSYAFPKQLLSDAWLKTALDNKRVERIRDAVRNNTDMIDYRAPWTDSSVISRGGVDMIYSQAVMEHVEDVAQTYACMNAWIAPKGCLSHQIDFRCHGVTEEWNGHWILNAEQWRRVRGNRKYFINCLPYSYHTRALVREGFVLRREVLVKKPSRFTRAQVRSEIRSEFTDADMLVSGAYVLAVKK